MIEVGTLVKWRKDSQLMGMVMETLLILYYQVKSGVLFQNIGILLMAFMGGLALGSYLIKEAVRIDFHKHGAVRNRLGVGLALGFGVLNLVFIYILRAGVEAGIVMVTCLLVFSGFCVAGLFAFVSLAGIEDQKMVISRLYAADLLGGCLGSIVGSLFMIPFLGMGQSAALMALLAIASIVLI